MRSVAFLVDFNYFRKLAATHYNRSDTLYDRVNSSEYLDYLDMWAAENECERIGIDALRSSEEVYLLLKLKGVVLRTFIEDEYEDDADSTVCLNSGLR